MSQRIGIARNTRNVIISNAKVRKDVRRTAEVDDTRSFVNYKPGRNFAGRPLRHSDPYGELSN